MHSLFCIVDGACAEEPDRAICAVPGCDVGQLAKAEARLRVQLPGALRSLYLAADGVFDDDGQWWVVWPLGRVVDDNLTGWRNGTLDESLVAFGDDGTGDPFCVRLGDTVRVARWSLIDHAIVEDMTFDEFEAEWLRS